MTADSSLRQSNSFIETNASSLDSSRHSRGRRILVCALGLTLPLLVSFVYFVWMPGTITGKIAYTGIKVAMLLAPVLVGLYYIRNLEPLPAFSKIPRRQWLATILPQPGKARPASSYRRSLTGGVVFGLLTSAFAAALLALPSVGDALRASGPQIREQVKAFGVMDYYFLFGFFIAVVHSALEEFFWRGFVYGHLRRIVPIPVAHLLAAVGFAAHHVVVLNQFFPTATAWFLSLGVAVGGLVWSLLYQRYGTLLGAWVSHLIADVAILIIGWQLMQVA
jgi:membrane protease YdiL (CAAX protease family)